MEQEFKEPLYRFNVKQSAKGVFYCEFTVRGDLEQEVAERAKLMMKLVKAYSTINGGEKQ